MTTQLTEVVTRLTSLTVDGRPVDVSLVPANPNTGASEILELHQKGLHTVKRIPLSALLKAVGWKVDDVETKQKQEDVFSRMWAGERVPLEEFTKAVINLDNALKPWKDNT